MGTNFYAIIPVKQRIADKLKKLSNELVNGTNIDSYKDELKNIQKEISECQVHLGKRSCGWSFCWDANNLKYYKPSLISIKEFIKENNAIIQNEYGEEFSWEQFIKDEIGYCLYVGEKTIKTKDGDKTIFFDSHRTYCQRHPEEGNYFAGTNREIIDMFTPYALNNTVDAYYSEFISKDGLRFATYTDFS